MSLVEIILIGTYTIFSNLKEAIVRFGLLDDQMQENK